jgi:hypothetical protein
MKTRGTRGKTHIDEDKVKMRQQVKKDLRNLLACGDEEGYIAMLKALRPDPKPEELVSLVRRFREERLNLSRRK